MQWSMLVVAADKVMDLTGQGLQVSWFTPDLYWFLGQAIHWGITPFQRPLN
jgi:hypothetical protein